MNKDAQRFLQEAERQGFVSKPVKKGLMYLAPNGVDKVTIHLTPSDRRALDNMIAAQHHEHRKGPRDEHRDMVCSNRLVRRMHR